MSFQVLKLLTDIRLSYFEEGQPGFKLHFTFSPNEYFDDAELTKTYFYQVSGSVMRPQYARSDEAVLIRAGTGWVRRGFRL